MSALDGLAKEVLEASAKVDNLSGRTVHISYNDSLRIADAILAAGYSKQRTISTVEELDALPRDSILIAGSRIYQKERGALMDLGIGLLGYEEVLEESGRLTLIYTPKES